MVADKDWSIGLDDTTAAKCNRYTLTQFATDCKHTQECKYVLSTNQRYGCQACDDQCFDLAVTTARENMEPLAYVTFMAFAFLFGVAFFNDYLMERDSFAGAEGSLFDGAKDQMEWIGIGVNGFNAFMGFVLFIMGFVYSSETGAAIAILLVGIGLMGACSTVAGGIFLQNKLTPLLLLAGNAGTIGLAFLLLLAGIIAGLSAGLVTSIGEKIDDDWCDFTVVLSLLSLSLCVCLFGLICGLGCVHVRDKISREMSIASPHYCAYMDDDQCKIKIRSEIQDQAVNLAWIMLFVLSFLVGKVYVTHREYFCSATWSPFPAGGGITHDVALLLLTVVVFGCCRNNKIHVQVQPERAFQNVKRQQVQQLCGECLNVQVSLLSTGVYSASGQQGNG